MKKRRTFSPQLKAEIILKVLKEEEPMSQIATEYGVHPNQVSRWKMQFLKNAPVVFQNEQKPINQLKAQHEKQVDDLYIEIGKLSSQLSWLKKKCGGKFEQN